MYRRLSWPRGVYGMMKLVGLLGFKCLMVVLCQIARWQNGVCFGLQNISSTRVDCVQNPAPKSGTFESGTTLSQVRNHPGSSREPGGVKSRTACPFPFQMESDQVRNRVGLAQEPPVPFHSKWKAKQNLRKVKEGRPKKGQFQGKSWDEVKQKHRKTWARGQEIPRETRESRSREHLQETVRNNRRKPRKNKQDWGTWGNVSKTSRKENTKLQGNARKVDGA